MTEDRLAELMEQSARITMRALHDAEMVDRIGAVCGEKKGGRPRKHKRVLADYQECARLNMTRRQCARFLEVSDDAVDYMVKVHGLTFRDGRHRA